MRVEEMALRSEIRQMLNEAGFNKESLNIMVKEVLHEEIKKAIKQGINETNIDGYVQSVAKSMIKDSINTYLEDAISRQIIGDWFHKLKVSVDVTNDVGESILAESEVKNADSN
jgi:hypothetical protein